MCFTVHVNVRSCCCASVARVPPPPPHVGRIPSVASLAYSWTATEGLISPSSFVCMETAVHTMNMYYVCVTNDFIQHS